MNKDRVALVLLGVIGVIAIGGLVLMYSQSFATGMGVYSNMAKYQYEYPSNIMRGTPLNYPPEDYWDNAKTPATNWNGYGLPKRYVGDSTRSAVPAVLTSGGRDSITVPVQLVNYYNAKGYACFDQTAEKAGYVCYPTKDGPMADSFLR